MSSLLSSARAPRSAATGMTDSAPLPCSTKVKTEGKYPTPELLNSRDFFRDVFGNQALDRLRVSITRFHD